MTAVASAPLLAIAPAALLGRAQVAAYALLGLPLAFAALPLYVYAPKFYAGLGLSLGAAGALLLAARLADAFIDPWLGAWSDRVQQRKRFIALFLLPLAVGMLMLFHPLLAGEGGLALWFGVSLAVVYAGFSAANIAYQAWGACITNDVHQRTVVTASREGLGLAGVVLAALLPQALAPAGVAGAGAVLEAGLPSASLVFVVLLALCAVVTLRYAPAGAPAGTPAGAPAGVPASALAGSSATDLAGNIAENRSTSHSSGGLWPALASLRMRRLLAVFALNGIASALPATLFLFFVADVLRAEASSGRLLALYFIAAAVTLPLWVRAAQRFGKRRAWLASMALAVAAFAWAYLLGPGDTFAFAIICAASGAALGADLALPPALLADVIERDQSGGREGAYFGIWNFVTKLNLALAAGLALPALQWAGYQPGSAATTLATTTVAAGAGALALAYCLVPCALKLCAAALLYKSDFNS